MHFHIVRRNPGSVLAASCPVLCSGCETAEGSEWVKGVYIPAQALPQQQQGEFWKNECESKVVGCSRAEKAANGLELWGQQGQFARPW